MSTQQREEAIHKFAEVTNVDCSIAQVFLEDDNWDMESALTKFFSAQQAGEISDIQILEASSTINAPVAQVKSEEDQQPQEPQPEPPMKKSRLHDVFPEDLTMVTWNVDAQEGDDLQARFKAVLFLIAKANPEVIFLQEMTEKVLQQLKDLMAPMYNIYAASMDVSYFCVTLVSKNIVIESHEVIPFPSSGMGRSAIVVEGLWQKLKLKLINTHLETTQKCFEERVKQFSLCMDKLDSFSSDSADTLSIFGGDLNIRDNEIGVIPPNVKDAWQAAGSQPAHKFTWDLSKNDKQLQTSKSARHRFDRIYYSGPFAEVDFKLIGTHRIKNVNSFPSDHFGLVCRFYRPPDSADASA